MHKVFNNNLIPEYYRKKIIDLLHERGEQWVNALPEVLRIHEEKWSLKIIAAFPNLSYNYAAKAYQKDGETIVIKAWIPGDEDFVTELDALNAFNGHGVVKLLNYDDKNRFLLLEHLQPGNPLNTITDDEQATHIAASVMKKLWQPVPSTHTFPTINDWAAKAFALYRKQFGENGPIPKQLFVKAEKIYDDLGKSQTEQKLLHGDLHHENIIAAQREQWLAIDPQGVIGEPVYETGAFLRNPKPQLLQNDNAKSIIRRRIEIFEEDLGFDRKRIHQWAIAQAVLSACWDLENNVDGSYFINCALLLNSIE